MSKQRFSDDQPGGQGSGSGDRSQGSKPKLGLLLLRVGLPVTLATAGIIVLLLGLSSIGIVLVGTAIIAVFVDFFARMTNESDLDREREEQARRTFMRTGRWPRRRG